MNLSIIAFGAVIGFIIGFIITCIIACVRFYLLIRNLNRPIVADLNSPKYKAMKDYDSYEDWQRVWA